MWEGQKLIIMAVNNTSSEGRLREVIYTFGGFWFGSQELENDFKFWENHPTKGVKINPFFW